MEGDTRIFSIYEGTTQLQVVAAIRYISNGTMLNNIKDMLAALPAEADAALKARVEKLIPVYEEALATERLSKIRMHTTSWPVVCTT